MKFTRVCLALALSLTTACSCISFGTDESKVASDVQAKPQSDREIENAKVHQVWQEVMMNRLEAEEGGASEAFGLFSEGGWADAGQVIIFVNKSRKAGWVVTVKPGQKTAEEKVDVPPDELEKLWGVATAAADLNDIKVTSFDGLIFEYVHAKRNAHGRPEAVKRVYMKTAGDPAPNHDQLVGYFQGYLQ